MQRSLLKFENAIKSDETKKLYNYYLKKFLQWCKIKDHDGLLQLKESFLQELLEDYLIYQKNRISPNSIPPIFAALELFFTMSDKVLNFKKLRKMFPQKIKISGKDVWQTEDIQFMLKNITIKRTRAMIHFLNSTGCRIGVLQELKMKHLQDYDLSCKKIVFYEGTNSEYTGFLTPEAAKELEEYFDERRKANEYFTPETPVFRSRFFVGSAKPKPLALHSIKTNLYRVIHGLSTRQKTGRRYNIQAEHGFRKRYATILKSNDEANVSLIECLLGHKGVVKLDSSYFNPSVEKLFSEFKKHIINLTIDQSEKLLQEKLMQAKKITEFQEEKNKGAELSKTVESQGEEIKQLNKQVISSVNSINYNFKLMREMFNHPELLKEVEAEFKNIEELKMNECHVCKQRGDSIFYLPKTKQYFCSSCFTKEAKEA